MGEEEQAVNTTLTSPYKLDISNVKPQSYITIY